MSDNLPDALEKELAPFVGTFEGQRLEGARAVAAFVERIVAARVAAAERDAEFITSERDAENLRALRAEAEVSALRERLTRVRAGVTRTADSIHGDSGWAHNSGCEGEPDCFACIELDLRRIAALADTPDREADRQCSTPGCPGDGRYVPPGRGHIAGCPHLRWHLQQTGGGQ